MMRQLRIDVFFDFICPWCLVGKFNLQAGIKQLYQRAPNVEVIVNWHGVQLRPDIAAEGIPFYQHYLNKLGSDSAVHLRLGQVRQAAIAAGTDFDFENIVRIPNTMKAHLLFEKALQIGHPEQCDLLLGKLFSAYFHQALDLDDQTVLFDIAASCGFPTDPFNDYLNHHTAFTSADTGGNGVPYFIFDGRIALAGAYPADVLCDVMLEALDTSKAAI